jgi:hypothetical protein
LEKIRSAVGIAAVMKDMQKLSLGYSFLTQDIQRTSGGGGFDIALETDKNKISSS